MYGLCSMRRSVGRSILVFVVCAGTLIGCAESVEPDGPGPIGPVGPVGAADETGESGSGVIVSEGRDVGNATRVQFGSEGNVHIFVGERASLTIEADDNLLALLVVEVEEDTLRIETAEGVDIAPSRPPRFDIILPMVTEIALSGVGDVEVESVETEMLSVDLSGVGDITLPDVDVGLLMYDLTGVGTLSVAGTATDQRGSVAGQCRLLAADLDSERAMLRASGGGYAVIAVASQLEVSATDSATVEYHGSPIVTQDVDDLGSVTGLGGG